MNRASPDSAGTPQHNPLHRISGYLAGYAARPTYCGSVKAFALKPIGIATGCVHSRFHAGAKSFARLVCGAEHSLAIFGTRIMESELAIVWAVVVEFISGESAFRLRIQRC